MSKYNFLLILCCTIIASCFSVNAFGNSVDNIHESGYQLMKNGEYEKAIETYTTILDMEEYDEKALLNRAVAFANIEDYESSLNDFSLVLEKNPEHLTALNGKATVLANFECISYSDCGPLQSLQILEKMLEINPNDEEILLKRNFMLKEGFSNKPTFSTFDVKKTNGDYIVNIQQIIRDKDGNLVSVIENAGTDISPTLLTEKYLDSLEEKVIDYKKEIVKIGNDDYVKWRYETIMSDSEEERKFFGANKSIETVPDGERNGRNVFLQFNLITAIFPAVNVDVGDSNIKITEVFKKI